MVGLFQHLGLLISSGFLDELGGGVLRGSPREVMLGTGVEEPSAPEHACAWSRGDEERRERARRGAERAGGGSGGSGAACDMRRDATEIRVVQRPQTAMGGGGMGRARVERAWRTVGGYGVSARSASLPYPTPHETEIRDDAQDAESATGAGEEHSRSGCGGDAGRCSAMEMPDAGWRCGAPAPALGRCWTNLGTGAPTKSPS